MDNNVSPRGRTWAEVRSELYTAEEIRESDIRVAIMNELIKARNERGICLFMVDGYINKTIYGLEEYLTGDVPFLVEALSMSFDPFVNKEIMSVANLEGFDFTSAESLHKYFNNPVKCLLRIEKSIELWTKEFGVNGYFSFLENTMGGAVKQDAKMEYAVFI